MGFLGAADIAEMIADLKAAGATVSVAFGQATTDGLKDTDVQELLGGDMPGVNAVDDAVHIVTGSLPGLTSGSAITVDGVARVVREAPAYGDGAMTRVALRRP